MICVGPDVLPAVSPRAEPGGQRRESCMERCGRARREVCDSIVVFFHLALSNAVHSYRGGLFLKRRQSRVVDSCAAPAVKGVRRSYHVVGSMARPLHC